MGWGDIGGSLAGIFGANEQENAEYGRYQEMLALGAPYRKMLSDSYKPGGAEGYLSGPEVAGPTNLATSALLRNLSMSGGNPFGNPGALAEAQSRTASGLAGQLAKYREQLGSFGGQGTLAGPGTVGQSNRQLDANKSIYDSYGALLSSVGNLGDPFGGSKPSPNGMAGMGAPGGGTGMDAASAGALGMWL